MAENCSWSSRLTQPFVLWGIAAAATSLTVEWLFKHEELPYPAKPILGFLPALLAIFFVVALVRGVRKLDEMVQRIHLQAASIAFLLTVILGFVFDGLEIRNLHATRSDLSSALAFTWGAALIFLSLRYR